MPELASGGAVAARDALREALSKPLAGEELTRDEAVALLATPELTAELLATASALRDRAWGRTITFSPKVFLPITNLCRDRCTYCTFRKDPDDPDAWTMTPDEIAAWSARGRALGCKEALMCLGDKPEVAFPAYRATLAGLGHRTTAEYVHRACAIALDCGLLPHTNAGLLSRDEMARLKEVNVSLGLMLENVSPRLRARGQVHQWAPDKEPALRLRMLREAGELRIPFTTGLLLGIGETLAERVDTLLAIRELHRAYGHVQEVIVQNFRAKPTIPRADASEPAPDDIARTVAVARLILDSDVSVQAPPNLSPADHALLLAAGLNDWGGISPLTPDYVNPEAPWPHVAALAATCRAAGYTLAERLAIYPAYVDRPGFLAPALRARLAALGDEARTALGGRRLRPRRRHRARQGRGGDRPRCDRSVHAGRHQPRDGRLHLPGHAGRHQVALPPDPRARLLAHGDHVRRAADQPGLPRLHRHAARPRPRQHPGHGSRDPRRRGARDPLAQEGGRAELGRDHHHRASPGRADHGDRHVRARRDGGPHRAPHRPAAPHPEGERRLHRVRAARLHLGEHEALPRRRGHAPAEGAARPPRLRRQPAHAARPHRQPADVVGEARSPSLPAHATRRLQRLRRHAHGGEHLARGGRGRGRVHLGRGDRGAGARHGPHPGRAHHPLRPGPARWEGRGRDRQPCGSRCWRVAWAGPGSSRASSGALTRGGSRSSATPATTRSSSGSTSRRTSTPSSTRSPGSRRGVAGGASRATASPAWRPWGDSDSRPGSGSGIATSRRISPARRGSAPAGRSRASRRRWRASTGCARACCP